MDFLVILGCNTSLYHSQGGATELEFGICLLTWRKHCSFLLNLLTGTAIGFHASREHCIHDHVSHFVLQFTVWAVKTNPIEVNKS